MTLLQIVYASTVAMTVMFGKKPSRLEHLGSSLLQITRGAGMFQP